MNKLADFVAEVQEFGKTGEGWGFDLRLDLAELVVKAMRDRGLSQREIARRAGMKAAVVNRIVHAEANCTFDTAGRILHAIGIKASLMPLPENPVGRIASATDRQVKRRTGATKSI